MKRFICILILIIFLGFAYARYFEPKRLKVNEYLITSNALPQSFDGLKIIHFSDVLYHNNNYSLLEKTIYEILNSNADIVFFTGDLIKGDINEEEKEQLIKHLNNIQPKLYKYAVLGDNDNEDVKQILEDSNFIVLDNTSALLFNEGAEPILIAGGDKLTNDSLLTEENISYNYKIALTHFPDNFDNLKNDYNLVLAGHSLGGEIRIPYLGAVLKKEGAQKYTDYHYQKDNNHLYVSFGLGTEKTNMRLFNMPSINIYRIYSK